MALLDYDLQKVSCDFDLLTSPWDLAQLRSLHNLDHLQPCDLDQLTSSWDLDLQKSHSSLTRQQYKSPKKSPLVSGVPPRQPSSSQYLAHHTTRRIFPRGFVLIPHLMLNFTYLHTLCCWNRAGQFRFSFSRYLLKLITGHIFLPVSYACKWPTITFSFSLCRWFLTIDIGSNFKITVTSCRFHCPLLQRELTSQKTLFITHCEVSELKTHESRYSLIRTSAEIGGLGSDSPLPSILTGVLIAWNVLFVS